MTGKKLFHRILEITSSVPAMLVTLMGTLYWAFSAESARDFVDGLLSGAALLYAQAIFKTGEPRDICLHKKLDSILDAIPAADSKLKGAEEK